MSKVGIILINYKDYAKRFLTEARDNLRLLDYPKDLYGVYIIDNASSPETQQYLKQVYPEAQVLPRDDGNYAAANNAGAKMAIADNCQYLVIANLDTKFEKNWLRELVAAIASDPTIGIAQSKILLYPKVEEKKIEAKINSLGNIIHFLGFGYALGYKGPDREINGLPEISGYASGCSFIIKSEVFEKISGYDEEYYMYHDDMEMGWKVKLAGWKIVLAPKSIIYHKYEFARSVLMVYYMERNRYLVIFHNYRLATIILLLPAIILMECGMIFYSIISGWFKAKMKADYYFLKLSSWKKIIAKRKQIKALRKKKDREIVSGWSGRVLFQEINNPLLEYLANPFFNIYWQLIKRIIIW